MVRSYLVLVSLLAALLTPANAEAASNKVQICHGGTAGGQLLSVSSNAWSAHQAHGDTLPGTYFADRDADGYGDADSTSLACALPTGFVTNSGDCDDDAESVNPGTTETCNGMDDDCSGEVDDGDIGPMWYADGDADGFGDAFDPDQACDQPAGYVSDDTDCDDTDAAVNPNASETCSPVDDDCDGIANESDALDAATWYADADLDGFGTEASVTRACEAPIGWVALATDCDDEDAAVFPGAAELCDGVDNSCDGEVDEDAAVDAPAWYLDADNDGYGNAAEATASCAAPPGYVAAASDCDDASPDISPDAVEICDGEDQDCDGVTDEPDALDASTWYLDDDLDGYGDEENWAIACDQPSDYVDNGDDCDDGDALANPAAAELCADGVDQTCEGDIDEGCVSEVYAMLPIELIGVDGLTETVDFDLIEEDTTRTTLYLQVHDLDFDGEGSVQLNDGPWWELQDELDPGDEGSTEETITVTVLNAGVGYGGIGGLFGTLKLEIELPEGSLLAGENTLSFRFNHTDGVTSGFRVIDFDLLDSAGGELFTAGDFSHDNPDDWYAPYDDAVSIAEGERLWREADLTEPLNGPIGVHCADCHTQDGRDLAYFGYSNKSIIARSEFHELTHEQGELIASYIRSLDVPHPGRPWNPPFQPGPGLDSKPAEEWAAGAGIEWVLDNDEDTLDYIFPDGISAEAIRYGDMNIRETPMGFQLLDWNHWLPSIHPLEGFAELPAGAYGEPLAYLESGSGMLTIYDGVFGDQLSIRAFMEGATQEERCAAAPEKLNWLILGLRGTMRSAPALATMVEVATPENTRYGQIKYSAALWYAVKRFELHQEFGLEGCAAELYGDAAEPRAWLETIVDVDPDSVGMSLSGMPNYDSRRPALALDYHTNAWWTLQAIQNSRDGHADCTHPIDWGYLRGAMRALGTASGVAEPGRILSLNLLGFQNVADRAEPDLAYCGTLWEPTNRGSIWPFNASRYASPALHYSETGEILPEGERQPLGPALKDHDHAELFGAFMLAWVAKNEEFSPEDFYTDQPGDNLDYPFAEAEYQDCDWSGCYSPEGRLDEFGILVEGNGVDWGPFFLPESLASQTLNMLDDARTLGVDAEPRQAVADWAVTIWPLIDWQELADDLPSTDPVTVTIDPGNYIGYWFFADAMYKGKHDVQMKPGKNTLYIAGSVAVGVTLEASGWMTPTDSDTATGAVRSLVLANKTVRFSPDLWTGYYGGDRLISTARGARDIVLIPDLQYRLDIGAVGSARFKLEADGSVTPVDTAAFHGSGSTLSFQTVPIDFVVGDYAEGWSIEYGPATNNADDVLDLVPGVQYNLSFGSGGGVRITVATDGDVTAAAGSPLTSLGDTMQFDPVEMTVTTDAAWHTESGAWHYGSDTFAVMPNGYYNVVTSMGASQLVRVNSAGAPTPSTFTLSGYTFEWASTTP